MFLTLIEIGTLKPDTNYELNGSFSLPPKFGPEGELDIVATIDFDIQSYILSGSNVDSIKLRDKANPIDVVRGLKSTTHVRNLEMRVHVDSE